MIVTTKKSAKATDDAQKGRRDVYPNLAREINERAVLVVFTPVEIIRKKLSAKDETGHSAEAASERIRDLETKAASHDLGLEDESGEGVKIAGFFRGVHDGEGATLT
ncbi:MAG: hypothetical protein HKN30_18130 [Sulfitobacter sp.]|nr:hypothetical protein [Sulfitobacter sp.]